MHATTETAPKRGPINSRHSVRGTFVLSLLYPAFTCFPVGIPLTSSSFFPFSFSSSSSFPAPASSVHPRSIFTLVLVRMNFATRMK
ncbi:hypothetical protein L209DRAFT_355322 [Thermothelomyces heterothallicus CBS 203.75]